MAKKKIADKKEVQEFLTSVLRDSETDFKDKLKVSEYLLKLADGDDERDDTLSIEVKVIE